MIMQTKCPRCGKSLVYSIENKSRPFCSEKCRLIDFGDWIEEKNRIQDEQPLNQLVNKDEIRH